MTTLVALPTRDAVVLGCDSLGTVSRPMIHPVDMLREYFDGDHQLRRNEDGTPVLREFDQIFSLSEDVPFDHMTHVDKLFHLKPLKLGVMFSGVTSIGSRTVKSLLSEFREADEVARADSVDYAVEDIGKRLLEHLSRYDDEQMEASSYPVASGLELILAGYNGKGPHPEIAKIDLKERTVKKQGPFHPVFGGQSREIERIVYGIDFAGYVKVEGRYNATMMKYAQAALRANGVPDGELPTPSGEHRLFDESFRLQGLGAVWENFSEQNAIDCVSYFIRIMSQAQRFSSRMPTVGGSIHVALVDPESGFRFISRREYSHEDHRVERS